VVVTGQKSRWQVKLKKKGESELNARTAWEKKHVFAAPDLQ